MTAAPANYRQLELSDPQVARKINHLLSQMTLDEKAGQMTMVENNSIEPAQVTESLYWIGVERWRGQPDAEYTPYLARDGLWFPAGRVGNPAGDSAYLWRGCCAGA